MQLRAYDQNGSIVFAHHALKHHDYFCLECRGVIRLRSGLHRQKHFYHLRPSADCRQNGKSMEHLQAQRHIRDIYGEECSLEHPFPEIGRIADCVCHHQKIVFEIQCSPIRQEEVAQRNADYASAGYRVVWILHDKRFNQRRLSAAEHWLQDHPHYFTNINTDGEGHIYDQFDFAMRGMRTYKLPPVTIDIGQLCTEHVNVVEPLKSRANAWKMSFQGDWLQRSLEEESQQMIRAAFERDIYTPNTGFFDALHKWVHIVFARPYRILFDFLLERACR